MELSEIINRVSRLRTRANLSARELSLRIGKNENYINRLEYRKDSETSISVFQDIAQACGSSLEELLYYDMDEYKKDMQIIKDLKRCSPKKKQAIIDLLDC